METDMMKNSKAVKPVTGIAIILFVITTMLVYLKKLDSAMKEDIIVALNEIGKHDIISIEGEVQDCWDVLEGISDNLLRLQCQTISEVQTSLVLDRAVANFRYLCLIDSEGRLYTDYFLIQDEGDHDFLPFFDEYGSRFVTRYDRHDSKNIELERELVLYGTEITPFTVEDVKFVKILGMYDISAIREEFNINSFDGRGYSTVIESDGDYVVHLDETSALGQIPNFFDMLADGELEDSDIETVREKIAANETFNVGYSNTGKRYEIELMPFEKADWYFVTMIERSVYSERADRIMAMTAAMFIVIAVVVLSAARVAYRTYKRSLQADIESRAKSEFLSNMSHEIRTPLNGLVGLNHLMTLHIDDKEKLSEYLEKSGSTAQYLLALLNNILDVSKMQAGKMEVENEPVLLEKIIDNVRTMQQENISSRKIDFVVEKNISVPCVNSDEVRLQQVLMNIVSNAAKFTPKDGTITLRAWQTDITGESVTTVFEVEDTGCGMSKEFQEKIFESFSQERNKIQSSVKGTGLGMAISYLIMKAFGGDIEVRSQLGVGSCFTVILPAEIAEPAGSGVTEQTDRPASPRKDSFSILVAEDNELNAEIISEILEDEGHTVELAENGRIAVDKFAKSEYGEFDVILMDVQMPVMDGYVAAKTIRGLEREDAATVKIFACTANTFKEDIERAKEAGMDDFLPKPVDISLLFEKLNH